MSKVLVIPDIHLKPWIFDQVDDCAANMDIDNFVFVGDLVDDWACTYKLDAYEETFDRLVDFINEHPNFHYCWGNHDVSYKWHAMESGYSIAAENTVLTRLRDVEELLYPDKLSFIHRIDNVIFSHAGLTKLFVEKECHNTDTIDDILNDINQMGQYELWHDISPIWARPQNQTSMLYETDCLQVVGHTPVYATQYEHEKLLTVDNFSTYRDGRPIGDQKIVWVDTVSKEWGYANEKKLELV